MKAQTFFWIAILAGLDFVLGRYGLWWFVVIPAFVLAAVQKQRMVLASVIGAILAWYSMGLYFDLPTEFRLSGRITGIIGLHGWALAYLAIGILVGTLASLAAYAGQNLGAGLRRRLS